MMEPESKGEISLEGDTILSKIGKLTTAHSPRVINFHYVVEFNMIH